MSFQKLNRNVKRKSKIFPEPSLIRRCWSPFPQPSRTTDKEI